MVKASDALTIYCSFCGKNQGEVQKIIAGPNVFICDECAVAAIDILLEAGIVSIEAKSQPPKPSGQEQIDKAVDDLIESYRACVEAEKRMETRNV